MGSLLFVNDRPGRYPPSWYAAVTPAPPERPSLKGETRADVCVIGGGYTGLSAALHLARQGADVVVLEAHRVGWGASGRNGGQVSSGQRRDVLELEARLGRERARALWDLGEEANALVKALVAEIEAGPGPACDWRDGIVEAAWRARDLAHVHAVAEALATRYGYDAIAPLDRAALQAICPSPAYVGGAIDRGAGHLNPLAYAFGLAALAEAAGARILERSLVHRVEPAPGGGVVVASDRGRVRADHAVLAGNGYMGRLWPRVAARVMPLNNFIIATEPLGSRAAEVLTEPVAVADSRFVINYFRLSPDGRLLFGGGESYGDRFPRDIAATVRRPMLEVFPQLADVRIDYAWGGTLAITRTRLPLLRREGALVSAAGYSGHGISIATLAGKLIAEALAGRPERFDLLAGVPNPPFPGAGLLRRPLLAAAMSWFALRDRLGI